jgi:hypothetical protein
MSRRRKAAQHKHVMSIIENNANRSTLEPPFKYAMYMLKRKDLKNHSIIPGNLTYFIFITSK